MILRMNLLVAIHLHDISMFLLLYADEPVLFSEIIDGLQKMFDTLYTYNTKWNIYVNVNKTKIVFRNGGKLSRNEK